MFYILAMLDGYACIINEIFFFNLQINIIYKRGFVLELTIFLGHQGYLQTTTANLRCEYLHENMAFMTQNRLITEFRW